MLMAVAVWSTMMILVRALSEDYTSFQILFIRTVVALFLLAPLLHKSGFRILRTQRFPTHLIRAIFAYFGMLGLFIGIGEIPLSEVVSLSFTQPIFIVVLAVILLGEKFAGMRIAATLGGFLGVLIVLRPGFNEIGFGNAVVLGGAISYACSNLCIKKLTSTENVGTTTLWVNILMCPLAGVPAAVYWVQPTTIDIVLLIGVGITGTAGIWFITRAYGATEMSAVVPFDFLRLPIVGAAGWLMFGEPTDKWTIAGAVVIFISAYLLARSEADR
ncbi:MAG: Riboflavin transporter [Alphaproteobacteria bacterium MarineAlpha11_Bin1]|nr:MAG: Riboflavin transporter [Alphaproteobacteria bacterium MarineAlpha11_Bin1]